MTWWIWWQILALPLWDIQCYYLKDRFIRISKPKTVLRYVYPVKRYNILKFEFLLFLVTKWREIQILKRYIFWLDKRILQLFFGFGILVKRYSKAKIWPHFVTSFFRQKCQNLKNKKHRILENVKFFFGA